MRLDRRASVAFCFVVLFAIFFIGVLIMSSNQSPLELFIDIFEKKNQLARVLPDLVPPELVEAILQEFRELEYLGDTPTSYQLLRSSDQVLLDDTRALNKQHITDKTRLILQECEIPLPEGTQRPTQHLYMRELQTGKVYKLQWLPAIIGRPGQKQAHNDWVAVNLGSHRTGLRVSRRHAQITESRGNYFIESLSSNPTALEDSTGTRTVLEPNARYPLHHGNIIHLERSEIMLKFIIRTEENR
jgi:hypothetical protein